MTLASGQPAESEFEPVASSLSEMGSSEAISSSSSSGSSASCGASARASVSDSIRPLVAPPVFVSGRRHRGGPDRADLHDLGQAGLGEVVDPAKRLRRVDPHSGQTGTLSQRWRRPFRRTQGSRRMASSVAAMRRERDQGSDATIGKAHSR